MRPTAADIGTALPGACFAAAGAAEQPSRPAVFDPSGQMVSRQVAFVSNAPVIAPAHREEDTVVNARLRPARYMSADFDCSA